MVNMESRPSPGIDKNPIGPEEIDPNARLTSSSIPRAGGEFELN